MKAKQKPGVVFQPHVHHGLQRGIDKLVNAIRPTLGPLASGVAIDPLNDAETMPEFLDDGGLIARRIIELPNRDEDMGAMLLRGMLLRQYERVGDGTATAAVLFKAIFDAGLRYIAAGGNSMLLRRHLERLTPCILNEIDRMTLRLEGKTALTRMAMSVCHDEALAEIMGEAFDLVGEFGRLEVREGYGRTLAREYVEGTYFHTGLLSRTQLPDDASLKPTYENPSIFLSDFDIADHQELFPILQAAHQAQVESLVIIVRSLSEKAVALLGAHNKMDKFKVAAVKLPGLNADDRMTNVDDLGYLTGAKPYLTIMGNRLESFTAADFGKARRLWADMRSFGLVSGGGNPAKLREHIRVLKARYHNLPEKDDRKKLQERIGTLLGGAITVWVGGFTEPDIKNRKAVAERTALALRSAIQEGVVPGGGITLLNCREMLNHERNSTTDSDLRAACHLLMEAFAAPARSIFHNAGYDSSEVMAQLHHECADVGFDVIGNQVVNMREAGILDSATTLKASVRNAISTAAMALTIDSLVHLAKPEMIGNPP
ncbi:MAG: hypothetical protein LCI00_09580 [Chloroflexi bacterium]|nr:hypothetical protein [Chloroflexota bacterium]MCC6893024.1 hypothetical protein [Anaerolineae bacterium]